jgi:2'-5' RNA ligase
VVAEDGVVVDLVDGKVEIAGKVPCGYVFVDGQSVGDITEASLKDRRILGEEGFVSIVIGVDSSSGKVAAGPEIHARGAGISDADFDEVISRIETVLADAAADAPPLALGEALLLPPRRARVLCASVVDAEDRLGALQRRVSDGLVAAGVYEAERRAYRPHVTVARLRTGARAPREVPGGGPEPVAFRGGPLTLFRSRLGRGGASYEAQARITLS